ncbi:p48 polypeptide of DNA primase, partial [Dimargaris xerosporica]
KKQRSNYLANLKRDIVFQYTYPRLDDKVTTGMNHLLKSPFCVHPKTGRVCVPIHPDHFDDFDPFAVPTLAHLLKEVTESESAMDIDATVVKTTNASKSSLRPFIKVFEEFVNGIRREQRQLKE